MHDEIIKFLNDCGFSLSSVQTDGNVHRFQLNPKDDKKSGWYIFFQNYSTKTGQPYYIGVAGNWRTGDEFEYKTNIPLNKADKDASRKKIEEAQRKAEQIKKDNQERARVTAQSLFHSDQASLEITPYQIKKKIPAHYGTKSINNFETGLTLLVPMYSFESNLQTQLVNVQRITESQKRFLFGGQVENTFHIVSDQKIDLINLETFYICEGFATGASIFQAIGKPVIITFTAHNLVNIATLLKRKYPSKSIIICGDDDHANPDNPGRTKAELAAKQSLGQAIFPDIEYGTDFNDMHVNGSLEKTRAKILNLNTKQKQFVLGLGYYKESYYFVSSINQQIQKISASAISQSGLLRLQPLDYWEALYPGKQSNVNWPLAASEMISQCHQRGIFRPESIRGRGVWLDAGRTVVHLGSKLWVDGQELGLHDMRSAYIYDQDEQIQAVHPEPLTLAETKHLIRVASLIKFKNQDSDPALFAGWLALAPVCGAIPWRPHMWLSGQSGTGKSYILNEIVKPMLQNMSYFFSGQTTEAGLRQTTGVSSLPVIFDEFETNDEHSAQRIKQILELVRQASSDSEAIVAKGGSSGEAMQFRPRFSILVASVRTNLVHEEDQNRFTMLDLNRHNEETKVSDFETLKEAVSHIHTPDYSARLASRMIRMLPTILASQEVLMKAFGAKYTMRVGQQMSAIISGFWALVSDHPITEKDVPSFITDVSTSSEYTDEDEEECLNHLLSKILIVDKDRDRVSISIREMIRRCDFFEEDLERYGIIIDQKKDLLCVATSRPQIKEIFSRTKWSGGFVKALSRIEGATANQSTWFSFSRQNIKCVKIPLSSIFEKQPSEELDF